MTSCTQLKSDFAALSEIGRDPSGGWSRPAFGSEDCAANDWFLACASEAGLQSCYDAFGNAIVRTPGQGAAVAIGSHLDTVPNGGAFDGALGVLAGLEVARRVMACDQPCPVEVIAFRDEEGRFGPFTGSRAMTGDFTAEDLTGKRGQDQVPLVSAMRAAGFDPHAVGDAARDFRDLSCYLELHIEQGRVLETRGDAVGLVTAIAGQERFAIRFTGQPDHAGTAPMDMRRDAFAAAARFSDLFRTSILDNASSTLRGTIGVVRLSPGQANVVPGEVRMALEIRDTDAEALARAAAAMHRLAGEVGDEFGCESKTRLIYREDPVALNADILEVLSHNASRLGFRHSRLLSGANHDAGIMTRVLPVGLLFVPSRDGRSHCPEEHTDWPTIEAAVDLLELSVRQIAASGIQGVPAP